MDRFSPVMPIGAGKANESCAKGENRKVAGS